MPDFPAHHYIHGFNYRTGPDFPCGAPSGTGSTDTGQVTCFACRKTEEFAAAHPREVVMLAEVLDIAVTQHLNEEALVEIVKRGLNSGSNDGEHEALTELADALGLTYDEETDTYS